jgi:hypothetical protein
VTESTTRSVASVVSQAQFTSFMTVLTMNELIVFYPKMASKNITLPGWGRMFTLTRPIPAKFFQSNDTTIYRGNDTYSSSCESECPILWRRARDIATLKWKGLRDGWDSCYSLSSVFKQEGFRWRIGDSCHNRQCDNCGCK